MNKYEFSEEVLKWSSVWTPREDCALGEIEIINEIFEKFDLRWDEEREVFVIIKLDISSRGLTRLTFLPPMSIIKFFDCSFNQIKSLEGGPIEASMYWCIHNKLKDLRGAPMKCESFECFNNPIEDFRVYAMPYDSYLDSFNTKLIFIDPSMWSEEELKMEKENIETSERYL